MAAETSQEASKEKKQEDQVITFTCSRCHKSKAIQEMKIITRFRPVIVVCQDCHKEMR